MKTLLILTWLTVATTSERVEEPAQHSHYLVWQHNDGRVRTSWLMDTGDGVRILADRPGLYVSGSEGLWQWRQAETTTVICEMDGYDMDTDACRRYLAQPGTRVTMRNLGTHEVLPVAHDPANRLDLCDHWRGAMPIASLGSHLFYTTSTYEYHCGAAHGFSTVTFQVLDVTSGRSVPIGELVDWDEVKAMRQGPALAAFGESAEMLFDEQLELTMVLPEYERGELRLTYQLTGDSCYACSDDRWDSYSLSVRLEAHSIPSRLAPYTRLPEALRGSASLAAPAGWSQVEGSLAEHLRLLMQFLLS